MATKAKCSSCGQAAFRDGLCIDHFRTQKPGASPSRLVAAATDEKITDEVRAKFKTVTRNIYVEQAKWYLNAFWPDGSEAQAEEVWTITNKFIELDPKKKNGNELDPVLSAHYLQGINKAMTALELKEALRRIDVDANGQMAVLEYLLFKYNRSVVACVNNPQGGTEEDMRKLKEAEAKCAELQKALEDLQEQLARQKEDERKAVAAEKAAKRAEDEAKAAEANARSAERIAKEAEAAAKAQEDVLRKAEDVVRAAEAEARAADAELKRQQDEINNKAKALQAKIDNPSTGGVEKGKAVQELAALKGADPLPLRKAKITQEAAVRKVEAERKVAEGKRKTAEAERVKATEVRQKAEGERRLAVAAREKAEQERAHAVSEREKAEEERKAAVAAREKAEEERAHAVAEREKAEAERKRAEGERELAVAAREQAEEQTKRVEAAIADTEQKAKEASEYLEELKKRATVAHGSIWWMQREITEAKKYLPRSKQ